MLNPFSGISFLDTGTFPKVIIQTLELRDKQPPASMLATVNGPVVEASAAVDAERKRQEQQNPAQEKVQTQLGSLSLAQERHEEYQYLDLIRRILHEGEHRPDRTGTGTLSLFAPPQLRFRLSRCV